MGTGDELGLRSSGPDGDIQVSEHKIKRNVGEVEMVIFHDGGKVHQKFKRRMELVIYDAANAIDVARAMTDAAHEAETGLKPVGDTLKASLVEQHRFKLTQRVALMLGTMRQDTRLTDGTIAQRIVEVCLKEIF